MAKIYAVRKGKQTGIFESWPKCQEQIQGVSGAVYKSFSYNDKNDYEKARQEAEAFLNIGSEDVSGGIFSKIYDWDKYTENVGVFQTDVAVFVDGSCKDEITSYSVVVYHNGELEYFEADVIEGKGAWQAAGEYHAASKAIEYCVKKNYDRFLLGFDHVEIGHFCEGSYEPSSKNVYGEKLVKACAELSPSARVELIWTNSHRGKSTVDHNFLLQGNQVADDLANYTRDHGSLCSSRDEDVAQIRKVYPKIFDLMKECPNS